MDDGEIVAALAADDPAGLAAAYDRYAAPLYGYCRWMLRDSVPAAAALRETFAAAAEPAGGLTDGDQLRGCLYGIARDRCYRRMRTAEPGFDELADGDGQPNGSGQAADVAEVRRLIRETLAELKPHEHEVIELSIRHNLSEDELAAVLEVSWSRAHGLATQAREHLEKALDGLLIARTGRESCPELAALLADWDGRLTGQIGRVTARHLEHCETCASRRHGALRPEVLSRLLPLAELPPGLREPILGQADDGAAATTGGRATAARGSAGLLRPLELLSWSKIRANPGGATAVAAVTVWIVAAMSATMVTLTGMHAARALAAPGHAARASPVVSAASSTAPASPRSSRSSRPDVRHTPALLPTFAPAPSASPTASAKPTASKSASPSPSGSSSSSASASPSPSPSPTRIHTPAPTPTATPT